MSKTFNLKQKILHALSELSFIDNALAKRAEYFVRDSEIENFFKKDGSYLDIGIGKGHIVERIITDLAAAGNPVREYKGIDVADKPLRAVEKRVAHILKKTNPQLNEKNPFGFQWASGEYLPFRNQTFDGVSCIFCLHHTNEKIIAKALEEAKRVIKKDGRIFIVEDLAGTAEEKSRVEEIDRRLNFETKHEKHYYKSDVEWKKYFTAHELKILHVKFFSSRHHGLTVQHALYVLGV